MPEPTVILGELAEDFTAKVRTGHAPDIESYASQHPELADRIRELFPALMLLEGLAAVPTGATVDERVADPTASLPPGTIFGQYRIEREIARGGMGIVYEAEHLMLHRQVALKILPIAGPQAAKQLERFLREAKTAAGLHHTNIVPVFDVGQVRGVPYYAMQYINGQSLDRPVHSEPPPLGGGASTHHYHRVADIGIQAAAGLAHAHQRGVIHRDIKPSNLLLDDQGVVWITDFGLARRHDDVSLTHSGQLLGTPRYMSPEQAAAAAQPLDHRTDIYSLGATLYELLTRRLAFDGPTPQDVVKQIIAREPIRPRQLDPHVPRDLETIVLKAMAKRPEDRYPTAQALAGDLQHFTNGEPIQARRISIVGRTWRWAKREPVVAGLVGAVVAALMIGLIGTSWFALESRTQQELVTTEARNSRKLLTLLANEQGRYWEWQGEMSKAMLWYVDSLGDRFLTAIEEDAIRRRIRMYLTYGGLYQPPVLYFEEYGTEGESSPELLGHRLRINGVCRRGHKEKITYIVDLQTGEMTSEVRLADQGDNRRDPIWKLDSKSRHFQGNVMVGVPSSNPTIQAISSEDVLRDASPNTQYMFFNPMVHVIETRITDKETNQFLSPHLRNPEYQVGDDLSLWEEIEISQDQSFVVAIKRWDILGLRLAVYNTSPDPRSNDDLMVLARLLDGNRLDRGRYVPLTSEETRDGWTRLQSKYPEVFTVPIDDLLAWHLKDDEASIKQKHRHAALFAANFDCRDRPNDPHPFVARGRLFTVLGEWDKAEADFAKAWQLGGTGWAKSECRRLGRDALNDAKEGGANRQSLEVALRKAEIAGRYLPPIGPHRWARVFARHRLGLPLDVTDQATLSWLLCGLPMAG